MKKAVILGIALTLIGILAGLFLGGWSMAVKICAYMGTGCLILAGIFEGSFVSGDRNRANYHSETREDRNERRHLAGCLLIMSIPNLLAAILLYRYI